MGLSNQILHISLEKVFHSPHIDVARVNPRCISVSRRHVLTETAHFEQFCCYTN